MKREIRKEISAICQIILAVVLITDKPDWKFGGMAFLIWGVLNLLKNSKHYCKGGRCLN